MHDNDMRSILMNLDSDEESLNDNLNENLHNSVSEGNDVHTSQLSNIMMKLNESNSQEEIEEIDLDDRAYRRLNETKRSSVQNYQRAKKRNNGSRIHESLMNIGDNVIVSDNEYKEKDMKARWISPKSGKPVDSIIASQIALNMKKEFDAVEFYHYLLTLLEEVNDLEAIDEIKEIISDELNHGERLKELMYKYDDNIETARD